MYSTTTLSLKLQQSAIAGQCAQLIAYALKEAVFQREQSVFLVALGEMLEVANVQHDAAIHLGDVALDGGAAAENVLLGVVPVR